MTRAHHSSNKLYWVKDNVIAGNFPPISSALKDPDGLLAIGGDLSPQRLLHAYQKGIFPWYNEGQPILWWSPDPRWVLEPAALKISRSLRKTLKRNIFRITFDTHFQRVIKMCAAPRRDTDNTWITRDLLHGFEVLHKLGYGHSVEAWAEGKLVGGLYGLAIGRVFFGESMFSRRTDASKVALVHLVQRLQEWGFQLIDCQVYSRHLQSLGAIPISREKFAGLLRQFCTPHIHHNWRTLAPA